MMRILALILGTVALMESACIRKVNIVFLGSVSAKNSVFMYSQFKMTFLILYLYDIVFQVKRRTKLNHTQNKAFIVASWVIR